MVGVRGFEPPTSASRTQRSTKLSHTPRAEDTMRAPAIGQGSASLQDPIRTRSGCEAYSVKVLQEGYKELSRGPELVT